MKKTNGRSIVVLAVFSMCFFCIVLTCLMLIISGTATLSISGFAVDNVDKLYIGKHKEIQIFEDGKLINSIRVPTSRTYVFTIQEGNKLLLSTSTKIYVMDLDGNILETKEDLGADTYNQISYRKRTFISDSGDTYKLSNLFGQTRVIKNNTDLVYQIDGCSFVVKVLVVICFVAMFGLAIWMLSQHISRPNSDQYFDLD